MAKKEQEFVIALRSWGDEIVDLVEGEKLLFIGYAKIGTTKMAIVKKNGQDLPFIAEYFSEPVSEKLLNNPIYGAF